MKTFALILIALLSANLLHAVWIGMRHRLWERRIARGADGVALGAEAYTVGQGPIAVLWVHGFADTPQTFRRMAERLAAEGRTTCRVMRLPCAAVPLRDAARQTLANDLAVLRAEVAALRRDHRQVWLVGHSMGAALALHAVIQDPKLADGVVGLAPLLRVSRRRSPVLPPSVWFKLAQCTLFLSPTFESCFSVDAVAVDDPNFTYHRDRFIPFATYRTVFSLVDALRGHAADLHVPVLAVLPEDDRVVDTPAAEIWLQGCPHPKRVIKLPDTAHAIPLEASWKNVTDEIAKFIRDQA